jgi:hypothetical protein
LIAQGNDEEMSGDFRRVARRCGNHLPGIADADPPGQPAVGAMRFDVLAALIQLQGSVLTQPTVQSSLPEHELWSVDGQMETLPLPRAASLRARFTAATRALFAVATRLRLTKPDQAGTATVTTIATTASVIISSTRVKQLHLSMVLLWQRSTAMRACAR